VTEVLIVDSQSAASDDSHHTEPNEAAITSQPNSDAMPEVVAKGGDPPAVASDTWKLVVRAILLLWALGAAVAATSHFRRVWRLRRALNRSRTPSASFSRELAVHCRLLRVPLPKARLCTGLPCPMVLALPRATLLWPAGLEVRLAEPGRRAVLIHELAHLKRRDHLTAWLEVAVACLWWWHPVVWWARRQLRQYAELASDAWVVAQLPAERSHYAKALIDVCEFISLSPPAAAPAVGMSRGTRRSFERRLHMILRQRISARIPSVAWFTLIVAGVLVLPGFSTGQDSADTAADPSAETKNEAVKRPPVASKTPGTGENTAGSAPAPVVEPTAADIPSRSSEKTGIYHEPAPKRFSEEELSDELRAITSELQRLRHKGKQPQLTTVHRVAAALGQLFDRFRSNGVPAENVVREAFGWILRRAPNEDELETWSQNIGVSEDAIERLIVSLLVSHEFSDAKFDGLISAAEPQHDAAAQRTPRLPYFEPHRTKKTKVQTLLRVVYDMPLDKAEILAKFLNDNVKGEIEARTDQEGLMVTADAGIQRTVAGIVSLMTGETVTLDLGGGLAAGHATVRVPVYHDQNPHDGTMINYAPTPVVQPGTLPGEYPPPPAGKRELRTRTVLEPDPTTGRFVPRTVLEERVPANAPAESRDRLLPSLTPQPTEQSPKERDKESTENSKEPPASASDSSSVFQFSLGVAR
jgi:beta-lactamase regulating signal transducer with metallopeptidase domain